jgi:lipopolysaccharide transport system ATP-binding protein
MAAVQALCTRGIVFQQGCIINDSDVGDTINSYLGTLEQHASLNLSDRTDRHGQGLVRLTGVLVYRNGEQSCAVLVTGASARFVFRFDKVVPDLRCGFTIYDQRGTAVANFNSASRSPDDDFDAALSQEIVCEFEELPLLPGKYRLNVAAAIGSELQDHVEGAATFSVASGPMRGRAVSAANGYGSVSFPHRWKFSYPRTATA